MRVIVEVVAEAMWVAGKAQGSTAVLTEKAREVEQPQKDESSAVRGAPGENRWELPSQELVTESLLSHAARGKGGKEALDVEVPEGQ